MTGFWQLVFWLLMLFWLISGFGWWWGSTPQGRANGGVLWLLLAILGAYAIGLPGLPGK